MRPKSISDVRRPSAHSTGTQHARKRRWAVLAALAAAGVVLWEYLLNAVLNPTVDWSLPGVAAHAALDLALLLPLAGLAVLLGVSLARRMGLLDAGAGALGIVGVLTLVFLLLSLPLTASRDLAHEAFGQSTGLSLAEVRTTVVSSDLTVQEATQLCSFGSLRNPNATRDAEQNLAPAVPWRLETAIQDTLVQLAAFLPLVVLALMGLFPRFRPYALIERLRRRVAPAKRYVRAATLGLGSIAALFWMADLTSPQGAVAAEALRSPLTFNACTQGGPTKSYDVSAIDVTMTLNRWGDHVEEAHMYALDANIPAIRSFEAQLEADRELPEELGVTRVAHGLRQDPIQPLVIRANVGECLQIQFTNDLSDGQPASLHILGLPHTVDSAGSSVGRNRDTMAGPGETLVYQIPIPDDPYAEGAYYFHDHGAGRRRQNMGLFGAIVVEPKGSTYYDVETGRLLDTITGSNWEAIIIDPEAGIEPDRKSFREFVIMYHEIGDESFTDIRDKFDKKLPLVDELAGVYRPGARALNYRSEPFRNRIAQDNATNGADAGHGKSLGYSSYPFGDPATPIPRSYVGEGVKTRLLHGGSEMFHVHHLHGGGDRWRRNPNTDPNNNFWKGLTKVPDPNLTSIHLDSQSIGPGTSYNLEHECGAGGCQQSVGDFLYHCHIGHHYLSGMWAFWRVFGTIQDEETNDHGHPLAVDERLFQADNVFTDEEAPSNTPPADPVSAGDLLGLVVDDGRVIVDDSLLTDPNTEIGLHDWIRQMLPPRGARLDNGDATVWNWRLTGTGAATQVWGEPDETEPFAGWVSPTPGQRPELRFNPKNGRYVWPLFRPQLAQRPPFSARHSGAPWLGEKMKVGRYDGLCAQNGVHPGVVVGERTDRFYPVSSITTPIQVTSEATDQDGMIFVLNEEEDAIRADPTLAGPLSIRSNVGDCVEILFTNKIPDAPLNKNFSKVNIHSHFVQFDPQASDGVITGFSYEQSLRPFENENRRLSQAASPGDTVINVSHTDKLRSGIWIGVGLGTGVCGTSSDGQPLPCTEVRRIVDIPSPDTLVLDSPLDNSHGSGEHVGVEFVRYLWYSDVDFGTVFFHQHVEFKDWDHGLFGTHIVEPKGSTYHDPVTGAELRSGTLVDVRVDPSAGGNPVAFGVDGSFRELVLHLHNNSPVEGQFALGGGTINLRAEPWRLRDDPGDDPAYRFSSASHGDPITPIIRAYLGDPVVVRGMGLVERVGGVRFTGHRFNMERYNGMSDTRDATFIGISERFDVSLEGGAGGTGAYPGDYLYYSTLGRDFESGAWGLLRVHDTSQGDLQPLPDQPPPPGGEGFPQLGQNSGDPPSLGDHPGRPCPPGTQTQRYRIAVRDADIVYNDLSVPDTTGVVYQPQSTISDSARTPLVARVNAGNCLELKVRNDRAVRSSVSLGEMNFDPQRSYGSAVGLNYDSTIAPGEERTYRYYADRELGLTLGINLGDIDSVERGAFVGIVVEPEGSQYFRPGLPNPLPGGGVGLQADVLTEGVTTREFVALFNDEDRRISQNTMPYQVDVEGFAGISYSNEPLALRDMLNKPADVFDSTIWGDPRHVVTVPAGTPLVYRVGAPWGQQMHVPTLEGHRWAMEPALEGSEQKQNDALAPGMSLDLHFYGGAGSEIAAEGDYLFLDRRQPFLERGLWNILRVTDGEARSADTLRISEVSTLADSNSTWVTANGIVGVLPAGDTAPSVFAYAGPATEAGCSGPALGRASVDSGSGRWQLQVPVERVPAEICIRSAGGGFASARP